MELVDNDFAGRVPGVNDSVRLFVAGDSVGQTLGEHYFSARQTLGLDAFKYTSQVTLGCGAVVAELAEPSYRPGYVETCAGASERIVPRIRSFRPDITALVFGAWEVVDWRVDGTVVEPGSPEHDELLRQSFADIIEPTLETGSRVLLLELPCMGQGDTPAPVPERLDSGRVVAVNRILAEFATADERVDLFNTGELLCPDGSYEHVRGGIVDRYDGVHYTVEGATRVWAELDAAINRMFPDTAAN